MILLVNGNTRIVARLIGHPNLGVLVTPSAGTVPPPVGVAWACDNSAYGSWKGRRPYDEASFLAMLKRVRSRPDCRWVAAPDVVEDHAATLERWKKYLPIILEYGQTAAFVAQDGCTVESLPWGQGMAAVFIGGSDEFKKGSEAARITHEARRRGLWVHMGRVNSYRRMVWAAAHGVTSVDGRSYSEYLDRYLPPALEFLAQLDRQRVVSLEQPW